LVQLDKVSARVLLQQTARDIQYNVKFTDIDIEDFLIRNGKINKYKTLSEFKKLSSNTSKSVFDKEKMAKQSKTAETLYFTKI
jgi:chemotaxis methyl-accepting protein methylase